MPTMQQAAASSMHGCSQRPGVAAALAAAAAAAHNLTLLLTGVDAHDKGIRRGQAVPGQLMPGCIGVEQHLSIPTALPQGRHYRHGVLAVAIGPFV